MRAARISPRANKKFGGRTSYKSSPFLSSPLSRSSSLSIACDRACNFSMSVIFCNFSMFCNFSKSGIPASSRLCRASGRERNKVVRVHFAKPSHFARRLQFSRLKSRREIAEVGETRLRSQEFGCRRNRPFERTHEEGSNGRAIIIVDDLSRYRYRARRPIIPSIFFSSSKFGYKAIGARPRNLLPE